MLAFPLGPSRALRIDNERTPGSRARLVTAVTAGHLRTGGLRPPRSELLRIVVQRSRRRPGIIGGSITAAVWQFQGSGASWSRCLHKRYTATESPPGAWCRSCDSDLNCNTCWVASGPPAPLGPDSLAFRTLHVGTPATAGSVCSLRNQHTLGPTGRVARLNSAESDDQQLVGQPNSGSIVRCRAWASYEIRSAG